jgi:uncharacterized protein YecT (DUF1311 family)
MKHSWIPGLFIVLVASAPVHAFDCAKASTDTEKLICSDDTLKQLDSSMGQAWTRSRELIGKSDFKSLLANQRAWLKARDERCSYGSNEERVKCLAEMIAERTGILSASARSGPGAASVMVPFAHQRAGSKKAYEISISGVRFADPKLPGEKAYNDAVDELIKQAPFNENIDFESPGTLTYESAIELQYASAGLVSALVSTYRYDGGAHPNHYSSAINVSPQAGVLTFDKLFLKNAQSELAHACKEALYNESGEEPLSPMQRQDMLFAEYVEAIADAVVKMTSWTFGDEGAKIHLSPYEVGPYASGSFECRLPMKLLRRLTRAPADLPK